MTVHACNFCLKRWKVTDETIFQKGFQERAEELQTGMFNICTGHFHEISNKE